MSFARPRLVSGLTVMAPLLAFALAGCSAGSASPASSSGASATSAASTEASAASASVAAGGSGPDACAVLPVDRVQSALGVTGVTAKSNPGSDVSYCSYDTADGKPVAATSLTTTGGGVVFDSFKSASDAVVIPGVADGAVFTGGIVYVKKADTLFGFQFASTEGVSPDKVKAEATAIAQAVGGRLP
jgi:hypothetical protein